MLSLYGQETNYVWMNIYVFSVCRLFYSYHTWSIHICTLSYPFLFYSCGSLKHYECDFSEVILTLGRSRTVMEFLCAAKEKKRSFRVFVAEGAPR